MQGSSAQQSYWCDGGGQGTVKMQVRRARMFRLMCELVVNAFLRRRIRIK